MGRRRRYAAPMPTQLVRAEGHLIDTGLMARFLAVVIEGGGTYRIARFDVGRTKRDYSELELEVRARDAGRLRAILDNLAALGCRLVDESEVRLVAAPRDGVAPDDFCSTTHHPTRVRHGGRTLEVEGIRMDAMIVVRGGRARAVLLRELKRGDPVVCGLSGVETLPEFHEREPEHFSFMKSDASSERAVAVKVREVAARIREVKAAGRGIAVVAGPVVVHTGGAAALADLIRRGWVDSLLSGNALAVHDVESSLFGSSLGIDVRNGVAVSEGHMNHLRAINTIRREGSISAAVRRRVLRSGIMYECVRARVPFSLAGSIRDDGPLPDTQMDLLQAQADYAKLLSGAGLALVLSSMLHGIGVGNMVPSNVAMVCVDIHQSVVTKLADRGSAQTIGVVTDVSAFLHRLARALRGRGPRNSPR